MTTGPDNVLRAQGRRFGMLPGSQFRLRPLLGTTMRSGGGVCLEGDQRGAGESQRGATELTITMTPPS